jgi:hypothetical protein
MWEIVVFGAESGGDCVNNPIIAAIIGDEGAGNQIWDSSAYRLFGITSFGGGAGARVLCEETFMFDWQDLFQWDRFITPTIIKIFYWLAIVLAVLYGLSGIFTGLATMAINPFNGFIVVLASIASVVAGIIFARVAAEFILIVFRINEHLGAIRDQNDQR